MASTSSGLSAEVLTWNEQDVNKWLDKIGLGKYKKRFKNNRISGAVLLQLDETLLDDLNITDIVHRDCLLEEIIKLGGGGNCYDGYDFDEDDDVNDDEDDEILSTINEEEEPEELENELLQACSWDQERTRKTSKGERLRKTSKGKETAERKSSRGSEGSVRKSSRGSDTSLDSERVRKSSRGSDTAGEPDSVRKNSRSKESSANESQENHSRKNSRESEDARASASCIDEAAGSATDSSHEQVASRATQMVKILSDENATLRIELQSLYDKASKTTKLEEELEALRSTLQQVEESSKKRESLEESMRVRLESELTKLQENNKNIKDQMESVKGDLAQNKEKTGDLEKIKKDLQRQTEINKKLLTEKKAFVEVKQRLQRNLQQSVNKTCNLEREIEELKSALKTSRKTAADLQAKLQKKSSELEQQRRKQVETRGESSRTRGSTSSSRIERHGSADEGIAELDGPTCVPVLIELLKEKDEKINALEQDKSRIEQRHYEDISSRKISLESTFMQKDARISALERATRDGEKLIAEYRTQNLKYIEEIYVAHRRCADLEVVIKSLQAQVAEKDSLIKILQGNTDDDAMSLCSWKSFQSLPPNLTSTKRRGGGETPNYYDISSLSLSYADLSNESCRDHGGLTATTCPPSGPSSRICARRWPASFIPSPRHELCGLWDVGHSHR